MKMTKGMSVELVDSEPQFILTPVHFPTHATSVLVQRPHPNTVQLTATFSPFGTEVVPMKRVANLPIMALSSALAEMTTDTMDLTDTGLIHVHSYRYSIEVVFEGGWKAIVAYSSLQTAVDFLRFAVPVKVINDDKATLFVKSEKTDTVLTVFFSTTQDSMRQEYASPITLSGLLTLTYGEMHDVIGCDESIDWIYFTKETIAFRFYVPYGSQRRIEVSKKELVQAMLEE